jgi:hypothetical protein
MAQESVSQDDSLESKLGPHALQALDQLCKAGCERPTLIGYWKWLAIKRIKIPLSLRKTGKSQERRVVELNLRQMDSRETAHPGFSLRDLRNIAKRASKLRSDVAKLRKTPLVHTLVDREIVRDGDLLASSPMFPTNGSLPFEGLILLPELAKQGGPQRKPDLTIARKRIHKYIYMRTLEWHDRLFAAIYNDLFPDDPQDEKNVQRWRSRHGLLDPQQKTKKRRNAGCC